MTGKGLLSLGSTLALAARIIEWVCHLDLLLSLLGDLCQTLPCGRRFLAAPPPGIAFKRFQQLRQCRDAPQAQRAEPILRFATHSPPELDRRNLLSGQLFNQPT